MRLMEGRTLWPSILLLQKARPPLYHLINSKHSEFAWERRNRRKTFVDCVNVSDSFRLKNWNMFRSCGDGEF